MEDRIYEFLAKWKPSQHNPICTCGGPHKCVYCDATELVEDLARAQSISTGT